MISQFIWLLIFLSLLLVLIVITELLHRKFKVRSEHSRKFLHISGGLMCLLFPSIFTNHWWLFALAVIAFAILFVTYKTNQLASVHQTKRYSVGSVLFPIPVYLCFFLAEKQNENLYFYLPVSLLTISDTAAEIAGNFWERQTVKFFGGQKTLAGSLSFFITAIGVSLLWLNTLPGLSTYQAIKVSLIIAAFTTITEAVTLHGWDNLSVPAITVFILLLFLTNPHQSL